MTTIDKVVAEKVANTVYLFFTHFNSDEFVHTLVGFHIPIDYNNLNPFPEPDPQYYDKITLKKTSPLLQFSSKDYPRFMTCSQMGSHLYFLGGVSDMDNVETYPRDVYVFDVSSSTCKLEEHSRMRTGKPKASTFVADGKLFVIGSENLLCKGVEYDYRTIQLFEAYDPETGEWVVVKDPPVEDPWDWCIPRVEGDRGRKVSLSCILRDTILGLEFNLDTYEWTKLKVAHPWAPLIASSLIIDDSIYQVWWYGFMRQCLEKWKSRPSKQQVHELVKLGWHKDKGGSHDDDLIVICHLGHKHFCYIKTNEYRDYYMDNIHMSISVLRENQGETSTTEFLYFDRVAVNVQSSCENEKLRVDCYAFYSEDYSEKLVPQTIFEETEKEYHSPCSVVQLQDQLGIMKNEIREVAELLVWCPLPSLVQLQQQLDIVNNDILKIKESVVDVVQKYDNAT